MSNSAIKIIIGTVFVLLLIHFAFEHKFKSPQAFTESGEAADASLKKLDEEIRGGSLNEAYIGNPAGTNIVMEFFDYNCGYCKDVDSSVNSLVNGNDNVKVVFFDYPILGSNSVEAAKLSLAVYNLQPDKYHDFHEAMMSGRGPRTVEEIVQVAKDVGVTADIQSDMNNPLYETIIAANMSVANEAGISGTPSFVVNGAAVGGFSAVEENLK